MLIQQQIKQNDIVTIKLAYGEEILTKVHEITETHYMISKPRMLQATAEGIGLAPAMVFADEDRQIPLPKTSISMITLANDKAKGWYIQATTGIAIATATTLKSSLVI